MFVPAAITGYSKRKVPASETEERESDFGNTDFDDTESDFESETSNTDDVYKCCNRKSNLENALQ